MKQIFNIVVLGKSGVGKSSLINYILGKEKAKSGAGKPITGKEFPLYTNETKNEIINIFDSWGVEAGKTEEWNSYLNNFLHNQKKVLDIEKALQTAIYCLSAETRRLEEFERGIIKKLEEEKLEPIIVITKSDLDNNNVFYNQVRKEFPNTRIVGCCNITQKIGIGSNKIEKRKFGLEKLKKEITAVSINNIFFNKNIKQHNKDQTNINTEIRTLINEDKSNLISIKNTLLNFRRDLKPLYLNTFANIENRIYEKNNSVFNNFRDVIYSAIDNTNFSDNGRKIFIEGMQETLFTSLLNNFANIINEEIETLNKVLEIKSRELDKPYNIEFEELYFTGNYSINFYNSYVETNTSFSDVGIFSATVVGGAISGSFIPGVGTLIGGVLGGGAHLLRKVFFGNGGRDKAKDKANIEINNAKKINKEFLKIKLQEIKVALEKKRIEIDNNLAKELLKIDSLI